MNDNLKVFLQKVSGDPQLIERLKAAADYEAVLELAKELGLPLTRTDIDPPTAELDERALENVTGGEKTGGCACFLGGGGGGKNCRDDIYGCACVAYGQGGDGDKDDFTCICAGYGQGVIEIVKV